MRQKDSERDNDGEDVRLMRRKETDSEKDRHPNRTCT